MDKTHEMQILIIRQMLDGNLAEIKMSRYDVKIKFKKKISAEEWRKVYTDKGEIYYGTGGLDKSRT